MSDYSKTPLDTAGPEFQGSVSRGILGSIVGMAVSLLAMLLCSLCHLEEISFLFHLLAGIVIGWFYRLFHGLRSKRAAYATVTVCTLLTCLLWLPALVATALGADFFLLQHLTAAQLAELWRLVRKPLFLCGGLQLVVLFLNRGKMLAYVDWQKGPWYIAGFNAGGLTYNLLPDKLPAEKPPERFAVCGRFTPVERIRVEGDTLRWNRAMRKERAFSVHDIAGVVLGPSDGSIVLYDKNYQLLAKFAGSMKNADLLLRYLMERNILIHDAPPCWLSLPKEYQR